MSCRISDIGEQFSSLFGQVLGINAVLLFWQKRNAVHSQWCVRAPGWSAAGVKQRDSSQQRHRSGSTAAVTSCHFSKDVSEGWILGKGPSERQSALCFTVSFCCVLVLDFFPLPGVYFLDYYVLLSGFLELSTSCSFLLGWFSPLYLSPIGDNGRKAPGAFTVPPRTHGRVAHPW